MTRHVLVLGGARSGKTAFSEQLAIRSGSRPAYLATAEALDAEMRERIEKHRVRRGSAWLERETPLELTAALVETDGHGPRLVDCLTLWLSNLMHVERDWETEAALLVEALGRQKSPVVLVTNEVGLGIVPDNALARRFRDAAGILNQMVARVADHVEFVVAGLPMRVK